MVGNNTPGTAGVLFLDIDGVLNSERYRYGLAMGTPASDAVDPAAVETLNDAVVFLASDEASAVTGIELLVDGGALRLLATPPAGAATP